MSDLQTEGLDYSDVPSLLVEIPRADLARLRAIEAAAVAWADWQAKADALEPAIYLHYPNEASTVYEGLNASAAALIKAVKP